MSKSTPDRLHSVPGDVVVYYQRVMCSDLLHLVARVDGHLDQPRLRQALRLSLDAQPVLGCHLEMDDAGWFWQRCPDPDAFGLLEVMMSRLSRRRCHHLAGGSSCWHRGQRRSGVQGSAYPAAVV
ncbi:MAG: hypothetical protein R6X16_08355, partial [Anaerolineae bacterium]